MISVSCCEIAVYTFTNLRAAFSRSYEIEGQNSMMSKQIKVCLSFFPKLLNHSITEAEFFHWLTSVLDLTLLIMLSRIFLLTTPISLFVGFISRHGRVLSKFSQSQSTDMKTSTIQHKTQLTPQYNQPSFRVVSSCLMIA